MFKTMINLLHIDNFISLNESIEIFDYSKSTDNILITIFLKQYLVIFSSKYEEFDGLPPDVDKKLPTYVTDIHYWEPGNIILLINKKQKTITTPEQETVLSFSHNFPKVMKGNYTIEPTLLKKCISELIKRNIINNSYTFIDDKYNNDTRKNIDDIDISSSNVILFHGTTKVSASEILKRGLRPMDTQDLAEKSMFRGNSSTIKNYTDKNVYLTPSIHVAKVYALRQADYNYSEPVVLKITIPDTSKLFPDDDEIIQKIIDIIDNYITKLFKSVDKTDGVVQTTIEFLLKKMPEDEYLIKQEYGNKTLFKTPFSNYCVPYLYDYLRTLVQENLYSIVNDNKIIYTDIKMSEYSKEYSSFISSLVQLLIPNIYASVLSVIQKEIKTIMNAYWKKSAYSNSQAIAYKGIILPKFIEEYVVTYKLKKY